MLTTTQAAEVLGITPVAVRHALIRGRIVAPPKVGRDWLIPESAVEEYRRTREPKGPRSRLSPP